MSLKIGIDLDDTVTQTMNEVLHVHNSLRGEARKIESIRGWRANEYLGISQEEFSHLLDTLAINHHFLYVDEEPAAVATIKRLQAEGHETYFISARRSSGIADTYRWFEEQGLPVKNLYFDRDKAWHVRHHGLDVLVDDGVHNIHAAMKEGAQGIVYTKPWNRDARNIQWRANSWDGVYNIVQGLQRGRVIEETGHVPSDIWKWRLPEVYDGQ